jgi:integrase
VNDRKSPRRANGEGTIYRHGGLWAAQVSQGKNAAGKRVRATIYGRTKQDVADKLQIARNEPEQARRESRKLTLAQYLTRWIEDSVKQTCRESTVVSYKGIVNNHIVPKAGQIPLAKFGPMQAQRLYADLTRAEATPRTIQLTHAVLRRAMTMAVRWGLLAANPCAGLERPRVAAKEMRVLDEKQVGALLKAAKSSRLYALYVLAIFTGMRFGEILGLQWADVDTKNRMAPSLEVRRTLQELHGKPKLTEPKTASGRRKIDLPRAVATALKAHKAKMMAEGLRTATHVFCNRAGAPLRQAYVTRKSFKKLLETAEIPHIRFHDLRHTAATLMLKQGIHAKVVSERLGHASIQITLDRYSHVLPSMQRDAADKLDAVFAKLRA